MLRALLLTLAVMIAGLPALAVPTDEMFEKLRNPYNGRNNISHSS